MTATDSRGSGNDCRKNADRWRPGATSITRDPNPRTEFAQLPDEVQARIYELHDENPQAKPRRAVPALRALIEQHPELPVLHNYLYLSLCKLASRPRRRACCSRRRGAFPIICLAISPGQRMLRRGETEKVPRFLGQSISNCFTPSRALSYHRSIGPPGYCGAVLSCSG